MTLEEARVVLTAYHKRTGATHWPSSMSVLPILLGIKARMKEGDVCLLSKAHAVTAYKLVFETLPEAPPTAGPFCSLGMAFGFALGAAMANPKVLVHLVTGDGEWDEGANHEAYWAMKRLGIGNVIVYVECNGLQAMKSVDLDQVPEDPQVIKVPTWKGADYRCHYQSP
jgi:transketolase N-terminal domain/subunit